jgi:hypothetical protein
VFATVMVSLLVPFVQHKIDNRTIEFSIEVDDIIVKRALEAYAGGAFGGALTQSIDFLTIWHDTIEMCFLAGTMPTQ